METGLDAKLVAAIVAGVVSGVTGLALAAYNRRARRELQRGQAEIDRELDALRADIALRKAEEDARRAYEFDARKRLYEEVEPLFFQLFHACEASYHRVASLARSQRLGGIGGEGSWLARDGYYLTSTIYNVFLPIAVYRMIQRSATFVDIELDPSIRTRFFLMKQDYFLFTDDFELAALAPEIEYLPDAAPEARSHRQGVVLGRLDRLVDRMIAEEGGRLRAMSYGAFESGLAEDGGFRADMDAAREIFFGFDFEGHPVLARALIAHALIMRLVLHSFGRDASIEALQVALRRFAASDEARRDLSWNDGGYDRTVAVVAGYVAEQVTRISPHDYDI